MKRFFLYVLLVPIVGTLVTMAYQLVVETAYELIRFGAVSLGALGQLRFISLVVWSAYIHWLIRRWQCRRGSIYPVARMASYWDDFGRGIHRVFGNDWSILAMEVAVHLGGIDRCDDRGNLLLAVG